MSQTRQPARAPSALKPVFGSRERAAAGSLFDRLLLDEEDSEVEPSADLVDAKVRSIKRNLARILNTRVGGAAANPALGVSDFNDSVMGSNDAIKHIEASIRDCILENEPRIANVEVSHLPDTDSPLVLQFSVLARIVVANSAEQIRIDLMMRDGQFLATS